VRQLPNTIAIVPNSSVAKATIVNYSLPEPRLGVTVRVSVDYASDLDRVEAALLDETRRAVGEVPGLLGQPEPSVRVTGFGDAGPELGLNVQVASYVDQYLVQHELRRRILRRFHAEGIAFPPRPFVMAAPSSSEGERPPAPQRRSDS
jgi:small-conductance mechanosensitive channel